MVQGCLDWHRDGLTMPKEVQAVTDEYRDSEDVLAHFLAECCTEGQGLFCRAAPLYAAYKAWWERNEAGKPPTQRNLGEALTGRGFERYTNNGTCYRGLELRQEIPDVFD